MTITTDLENVFAGKAFFIPDYQRGYSWERKEWNDLVEDLELLPPQKTHYAGTLVIKPMTKEKADFIDALGTQNKHYELIDGQQRLTTVLIFLKVIEGELERLGFTDLVAGLRVRYLAAKDIKGWSHYRLNYSDHATQEFFTNQISGEAGAVVPTTRSQQLLSEARQFFKDYITKKCEAMGPNDFKAWLPEFYLKITHCFTLIQYQVEDELDAGVIFETMNDRGRELTELEKAKNYFLYLSSKLPEALSNDLRQKINAAWKVINERLMLSGLANVRHEENLLRVHWLMAFDTNEENWQQYRSIKAIFSFKKLRDDPDRFAQELTHYLAILEQVANAYCDIYTPLLPNAFKEFQPEVRARIQDVSIKLCRLGVRSPFFPLLIAVRLTMASEPEAYYRVAELSEKIIFRMYALAGSRSNWGRGHLYRLAHELYQKGGGKADPLLNEMTRLVDWYCSDKKLEEIFSSDGYNWYAMERIGYLLFEYDRHLARAARHPQVAWEDLFGDVKRQTIEHILPQDASKPYWTERFDEEAHQRWVNNIGNLTLTFDNSSLSNKSFPDKRGNPGTKNCYASSKLFVEQELAQYMDWTEDQIIQRRDRILSWARERWYIQPYQPSKKGSNGTKENSAPGEHLTNAARNNGYLEEFELLLETLRKFPVHLRMQRNWWGVSVTPPENKSISIFWLGPDLYFSYEASLIEKYFRVPAPKAVEILGPQQNRNLKPVEVEDLVADLNRLLEVLNTSQRSS